jgi:RecJ-like exonuclease
MDFQVTADGEGKKYERWSDLARDHVALKHKIRRELGIRQGTNETSCVTCDGSGQVGIPGGPCPVCGGSGKLPTVKASEPTFQTPQFAGLAFRHWSKDPLVPYKGCQCDTCLADN